MEEMNVNLNIEEQASEILDLLETLYQEKDPRYKCYTEIAKSLIDYYPSACKNSFAKEMFVRGSRRFIDEVSEIMIKNSFVDYVDAFRSKYLGEEKVKCIEGWHKAAGIEKKVSL